MASPAQVSVDMDIPNATSLAFAGLEWESAVSTPFVGHLDVTSASASLNLAGLLGGAVTVGVRGSNRRAQTFSGEIDRAEQRHTVDGRTAYRLTIRPTAWRLADRAGSRVHFDQSPVDIVNRVLSDAGIDRVSMRHAAAVDPVAQIVRHDESEWDFVERLLRRSGLHYYFEHGPGGDTLVVDDVPNAARRKVSFVGGDLRAEGATRWTVEAARGTSPGLWSTGEVNVPGIEAGQAFLLSDHPRADQNIAHLPVSARHRVVVDGSTRPGRAEMPASFTAAVVAVPATFGFGAAGGRRSSAPAAAAPLTAVVTGPEGERIHVDEMGRVRVRLEWQSPDEEAMLAPVAQPSAGDGHGTTMWPRVGDRVWIEFEDGDVSRPVVTGSLYDAAQPPPTELPAGRFGMAVVSTASRIVLDDRPGHEQLSTSTAGDQLGAVGGTHSMSVLGDQITSVGARRTTIVGRDAVAETGGDAVSATGGSETTSVGGDRWISVGGDETTSVGGDEWRSVAGDRTVSVGGDQAVMISGDQWLSVDGDRAVSVDGDAELIAGGEVLVEAGSRLVLRCGDASITLSSNGDIDIRGDDVSVEASGDLVLKGSKIVD